MASELDSDRDARDLADCRPSPVINAAAGAAAFSGVGSLMLALQGLLIGASGDALASSALAFEGLLGVSLVAMAIWLLKMQVWSTIATAALSLVSAVAILGWSLFASSRGLFSILGFAVPGLCMIAALLSLLAIKPALRASAARQRLRERGVSFGL